MIMRDIAIHQIEIGEPLPAPPTPYVPEYGVEVDISMIKGTLISTQVIVPDIAPFFVQSSTIAKFTQSPNPGKALVRFFYFDDISYEFPAVDVDGMIINLFIAPGPTPLVLSAAPPMPLRWSYEDEFEYYMDLNGGAPALGPPASREPFTLGGSYGGGGGGPILVPSAYPEPAIWRGGVNQCSYGTFNSGLPYNGVQCYAPDGFSQPAEGEWRIGVKIESQAQYVMLHSMRRIDNVADAFAGTSVYIDRNAIALMGFNGLYSPPPNGYIGTFYFDTPLDITKWYDLNIRLKVVGSDYLLDVELFTKDPTPVSVLQLFDNVVGAGLVPLPSSNMYWSIMQYSNMGYGPVGEYGEAIRWRESLGTVPLMMPMMMGEPEEPEVEADPDSPYGMKSCLNPDGTLKPIILPPPT